MASPNRFEISEQTHSANFAMYNFHSHSWYEIFYLQSGQCTFYIQDRTYLMNEGDIAVIPPDIPHKTAYLAEVNKRLCIEFSANYSLLFPCSEMKLLTAGSLQFFIIAQKTRLFLIRLSLI